jgi:tight adherence protein B
MGLIIGLVFLGVFAVVALVMSAFGGQASQQAKQVHDTLDSALATDTPAERSQIVNLRKSDEFSSIPWINQKLLKFELAPRLQNLLYQADLTWTTGQLLTICGVCLVIGAALVLWQVGSIPLALLAGLACSAAPFGLVVFKRRRRLDRFQEVLPEALDLMVSAMRAGHSLVAAMGSIARECADPVGCEFKTCFEEQNYGLEIKTALDNMINRVPLQDLRIVATAIMIQKESGGNLAEVLDKTSHVIRERFRLKRQVATHTAQGRMTGWVLTLLPIVLGVALYGVNPTMMSVLWTTEVGVKMLWISGSMIVVGGLIIRKIVNVDV